MLSKHLGAVGRTHTRAVEMQVPAGDRAPQFSPLLSRPPQFVSQNAGCPSPRSFTAISFVRQPGEMGFPSKAEDELELSGQGTESDCDGGTARGSARSRGRGRRPPSSGNSGHCRGCSVRGWTGYRQKQLSDRMKDGGRPDRTLSEPRLGSRGGGGVAPRTRLDRRVGGRDIGLGILGQQPWQASR